MARGVKHPEEVRQTAIARMRAGETAVAVGKDMRIDPSTLCNWRAADNVGKRKTKARAKAGLPSSATSYLAKQLEIVSKMLRAKLPELARFALVTTADGKTTVEYTVRQLTEVSGSVKL